LHRICLFRLRDMQPNKSPEPTWLSAAVLRKDARVYHVTVPTWLSFFR
jgi:hypothetical protein